MDLGKINRDAEDRSVVWGAVAAAALGAVSLIGAALARAAGDGLSASGLAVIGIAQLGLAFGVYRGSRFCAVAVFGLWIADRLIGMLTYGPGSVASVWTVVFTVMLFAAMRGTFAQHARRAGAAAARSAG